MKTKQPLAVLALVSAFSFQPSALLAQGSLTPPGTPGATMKTLAQIEPRTPIGSAPFTISQPGSYYLTADLTVSSGDAIRLNASGVTLDLNGFTIRSSAGSATGTGISINGGVRNITIANGFIEGGVANNGSGVYSGSGFGSGILYSGGQPGNVLVSRVSAAGCLNSGIYLGTSSTVVESCTVRTVGGYGICATTIKQSCAIDCGDSAIYGYQVSDCRGESSGGDGVSAQGTAQNCIGYSISGNGVYAFGAAQNCYGRCVDGAGNGVYAYGTALNCIGYSKSGNGVIASTAQNCYGTSSSATGVYADTAQNCYGTSTSAHGIYAVQTALGCYGSSSTGMGLHAKIAATCAAYCVSGTIALEATIANSCYSIGNNSIAYKYNMP